MTGKKLNEVMPAASRNMKISLMRCVINFETREKYNMMENLAVVGYVYKCFGVKITR